MKLNVTLTVLLAVVLVLTACAPREPEPAAEATAGAEFEAAMNSLRDAYVAAANAGDAAGLANLFTDDAVQMEPNRPVVAGKEAIQSRFQEMYQTYSENLAVSVDERAVAGDWGYGRGSYTLTLTPKAGGNPIEDIGKWLNVVQRQADGSWKIARHIWNSNKPLPGAPQ